MTETDKALLKKEIVRYSKHENYKNGYGLKADSIQMIETIASEFENVRRYFEFFEAHRDEFIY